MRGGLSMKKKYILWINLSSFFLFIASLVAFSIHGDWFWVSTVLLVLSILALGIGYYFQSKERKIPRNKYALSYGINAATNIIFVLSIIALLSFITTRRHARIDTTHNKLFSMADQTVNVMKNLKKKVKAYVFVKESEAQPLKDLLDEYKYLSSKFDYEIVDPMKNPGLAKQYNIDKWGEAVFICEGKRQKIEKVDEPNVTNAIVKVSRDKAKVVYFMTGHGEKDINNSGPDGYKSIANYLKDENYEVKTLNLMKGEKIPEDCSVLVIAAPESPYFPAEIDSLQKYLKKGGSIVILADFQPETPDEIKEFSAQKGIKIGRGLILEPYSVGQLLGLGPAAPLVQDYKPHKITEKLDQISFFPKAVNLAKNDTVKTYEVKTLLQTSANSWADLNIQGNKATFDKNIDIKGPIPLAMIAEKENKGKKSILVVFGDADFISNQFIRNGAHRDLFQNTINYAAGEEELISVRPKKMDNRRITMTKKQSKMVLVSVILLPLLIVIGGFVVYFKRRK